MLIAAYHPSPEGGAERQCRRLSTALAARGYRVRVLTIRRSFAAARREHHLGVEIFRLGICGPLVAALLRFKDRLRSHRAQPRVARTSSQRAPTAATLYWHPTVALLRVDKMLFMAAAWLHLIRHRRNVLLIHCHESHWLAGFAAWVGARLKRPVLIKEANYPVLLPLDTDCPWRSRLQAARLTAHYLAQTPAAAAALEQAGVDAARIAVVANGVEVPAEPAEVASNHHVLFVGHLYNPYKKALDVLFAAWPHVVLQDPSARLIVVGDGDQRPWKRQLEQEGIAHTVEFAGAVSSADPYYRRAAALLLPSRREGLSNALLEAQSWGIPAVVSDIPGNRSLVQPGVNGLIVPLGDPAALAGATLSLLADPAYRAALGQTARVHACARPGFAQFADQTVQVYRDLCRQAAAGIPPVSPELR